MAVLAGTGVDHAEAAALVRVTAVDESVRIGYGRVHDPGHGEPADDRDEHGETKAHTGERPHDSLSFAVRRSISAPHMLKCESPSITRFPMAIARDFLTQ
jgi:hypothetical protein